MDTSAKDTIKMVNMFGHKLSINTVQARQLKGVMARPYNGYRYDVHNFRFSLKRNGQIIFSEGIAGNKFDTAILDNLIKAQTGDSIIISNVLVRGPAGALVLKDRVLIVKY